MATMARLQGVTRTFKQVTAIRDLDLALEPGRIYGLLGPNGSGKTTTLRTMLGLIEPDRGQVELLGGPPNDSARARVGFVPEQRGLPETSRVEACLVFVGQMRGFSKAQARARAADWMERFDLTEKAGQTIKTLSNGQQQKVQIALALMCEPELILMDEPLAALDPEHQDLVTDQLRSAAAAGATVVLSTHRLHEAQTLIDHVLMMHCGEKVLDRPLQEALMDAFDGTWRIRADGDLGWVKGPEIAEVATMDGGAQVTLIPGAYVAGLFARAAKVADRLRAIEAVIPTLHDLYMIQAEARRAA